MDKARVIDFYKIDDQGYQSICTIIGLKTPPALTGEQLDQFDRVRGWLDKKEVKNFKEAKDRFDAEAASAKKPGKTSKEITIAFDAVTESKAAMALDDALNVLDSAAQNLQGEVLNSFYAHVLKRAQSPEIQKRLQQSHPIVTDIPAIEAEFTTVETPTPPSALPAQKS